MNAQSRFEAVPDTIAQDLWSVHQDGALVYEEMNEWEARTTADLLNPTFDHRNAEYAARSEPGWMPRPWKAGPRPKGEKKTPPDDRNLWDWLSGT